MADDDLNDGYLQGMSRVVTESEVQITADEDFELAIQELRCVRPLLLDAAKYAEGTYLNSATKNTDLNNVREYAVSMLVNVVERLGSVADKLSSNVTWQMSETNTTEMHVASLHKRIQACQEHTTKEMLSQQQLMKSTPQMNKNYLLPGGLDGVWGSEVKPVGLLREDFSFMAPMDRPQVLESDVNASSQSPNNFGISGSSSEPEAGLSPSVKGILSNLFSRPSGIGTLDPE